MKLDEIEIGKEYRTKYGQGGSWRNSSHRVRVDSIDKVPTSVRTNYHTNEMKRFGPERRMVKITALDETTGEPLGKQPADPYITSAQQLTEPWSVYQERQAKLKAADQSHDAVVSNLDDALRSIGIDALRFGSAGHREKPAVSIVITHEQAAKLCEELQS